MGTSQAESQRTSSPKEAAEAKLRVYPDLTYYYGLSPRDIAALPKAVKRAYIEAIPRLLALDQLRAIQAASFPKYKAHEQRRINKELEKQASKGIKKPATELAPPDLERSVHGVGIGMKKVPKGNAKAVE